MRKKLICLLLVLALCLSLAGCGKLSYGVNPVMTLASQEYSMAFRNGDSLYYYVVAAIEELNAEVFLEALQVLAEGGLGYVQLLRCPRQWRR